MKRMKNVSMILSNVLQKMGMRKMNATYGKKKGA